MKEFSLYAIAFHTSVSISFFHPSFHHGIDKIFVHRIYLDKNIRQAEILVTV